MHETQDLCGIFTIAKWVFCTRVFNMDPEFLKLEVHIRTRVWNTCFASVKMPQRSQVFKTRVLCKKNFTYSGVFKLYSDVLKSYSGIFLQKNFISTRFREPYSGIFRPYSDVFFAIYGNRVFKTRFSCKFFSRHTHPLTNRDLKTQILPWN